MLHKNDNYCYIMFKITIDFVENFWFIYGETILILTIHFLSSHDYNLKLLLSVQNPLFTNYTDPFGHLAPHTHSPLGEWSNAHLPPSTFKLTVSRRCL